MVVSNQYVLNLMTEPGLSLTPFSCLLNADCKTFLQLWKSHTPGNRLSWHLMLCIIGVDELKSAVALLTIGYAHVFKAGSLWFDPIVGLLGW